MLNIKAKLEHYRIDDAVDAVAVHGGSGVWGVLAVAFFRTVGVIRYGVNSFSTVLGTVIRGGDLLCLGVWY